MLFGNFWCFKGKIFQYLGLAWYYGSVMEIPEVLFKGIWEDYFSSIWLGLFVKILTGTEDIDRYRMLSYKVSQSTV